MYYCVQFLKYNDMKKNISIGNEQNAQQVLVIGVGGFGCKVAAKLNKQKHPDFTIVACDTDQRDLESVEVSNRLLLDSEQPGLFAQRVDKSLDYHNGDTACGQDYLEFAVQPFSQLMTDDIKSVIVVAGMGGNCGTSAAIAVAQDAKVAGKAVFAVVSMPFRFEGSLRMKKAQEGIAQLVPNVGELRLMNPHNIIDGNTNAALAFDLSEQLMCDAVEALCVLAKNNCDKR